MCSVLTVRRRRGTKWTDDRKRGLSGDTNNNGHYNDIMNIKIITFWYRSLSVRALIQSALHTATHPTTLTIILL